MGLVVVVVVGGGGGTVVGGAVGGGDVVVGAGGGGLGAGDAGEADPAEADAGAGAGPGPATVGDAVGFGDPGFLVGPEVPEGAVPGAELGAVWAGAVVVEEAGGRVTEGALPCAVDGVVAPTACCERPR